MLRSEFCHFMVVGHINRKGKTAAPSLTRGRGSLQRTCKYDLFFLFFLLIFCPFLLSFSSFPIFLFFLFRLCDHLVSMNMLFSYSAFENTIFVCQTPQPPVVLRSWDVDVKVMEPTYQALQDR